MVEAGSNIGADAHLPCLKNDYPNPPGLCFLFLNKVVELCLRRIECEWLKWSCLGAELECGLGEIGQVGAQAQGIGALREQFIEPGGTHAAARSFERTGDDDHQKFFNDSNRRAPLFLPGSV